MPQISVIVPVYKVEPYLHRCVDSILAQTFTDFELILVDDGSPDNCGKICDEYAEKDSRIKVIHQENGGLSAARNAGLDIADGKFVVFVDSDDYILEDHLKRINEGFNGEYDLVSFGLNIIKENKIVSFFCPKAEFIIDNKLKFIANVLLQYKIGWEACSKAYRRSIIEKQHLRFIDNKIIYAEDLEFNLCYCVHIKSVIAIPTCSYQYCVREESIMSTTDNEKNINKMNELSKAVLNHYKSSKDCQTLIDYYPIIYALIVNNAIQRFANKKGFKPLYEIFKNNIEDNTFSNTMIKHFLKMHKEYLHLSDYYSAFSILNNYRYIANGNFTLWRIRNFALKKMYFDKMLFKLTNIR